MDTPTLVQNDVTSGIIAYQAHHKLIIKGGPGNEATHIASHPPRASGELKTTLGKGCSLEFFVNEANPLQLEER